MKVIAGEGWKMKSNTTKLQAKTVKSAHRQGLPWDDYEVSILVAEIERDTTTFDIAIKLGRTLYGTSAARSHVRFAINHKAAIYG